MIWKENTYHTEIISEFYKLFNTNFSSERRKDLNEYGKKRRTETISWHGLRHTYAQRTYAEALQERPKKAGKIVSENLSLEEKTKDG